MVKERKEVESEKDLLQMILESFSSSDLGQAKIDGFIVDNCKNIYLAGYETTAVSATWTLMLLASNPEWQDRVRAEVVEICGDELPDNDRLRKMKTVSLNNSFFFKKNLHFISLIFDKDLMKIGVEKSFLE